MSLLISIHEDKRKQPSSLVVPPPSHKNALPLLVKQYPVKSKKMEFAATRSALLSTHSSSFTDTGRPSYSPSVSVSSSFKVPLHTTEDNVRSVSRQTTRGERSRSNSRQTATPRSGSINVFRRSSTTGKSSSKSKDKSESKSLMSRFGSKPPKSENKPTVNGRTIVRVDVPSETNSGPEKQEHADFIFPTRPTVPFDRSVDLVAIASDIEDVTLPGGVCCPADSGDKRFAINRLPTTVQRMIYAFCFPTEPRKVSLSPWFATKAVFNSRNYFAHPLDILDNVSGGLQAFHALRKDLMNFFWTNYHFHVTLNTFSGPKFSPFSHVWLHDYLPIVQFLTVEVDFTRFGGDCVKIAPEFGYHMRREEKLLMGIIAGLRNREESPVMAELNLLCRRYAGYHPYQDPEFIKKFGASQVPYLPERPLHLFDAFCALQGIVKKVRMAGFPIEYTEVLLSTTCRSKEPYDTPTEPAWPPLPDQSLTTSFASTSTSPTPCQLEPKTSFRSTRSALSSMEQTPSFSSKTPYLSPAASIASFTSTFQSDPKKPQGLGIQLPSLPRSRSFTQEIEDGIRSSSSAYSNYTLSNGQALEKEKRITSEPYDGMTAAEYATQYQELLGSMPQSNSSNTVKNISLAPHAAAYSPATPRSTFFNDERSAALFQGFSSPRVPTPNKQCATLPRESLDSSHDELTANTSQESSNSRALTPNTLERMNASNEQDPAFIAGVKALRCRETAPADTPQLRSSSALGSAEPESPERCRSPPKRSTTSLGNNQKGEGRRHKDKKSRDSGTLRKHKWSTFIKRFRGSDHDDSEGS